MEGGASEQQSVRVTILSRPYTLMLRATRAMWKKSRRK